MKKVNVLTHSLGKNYGGILQAFALKNAIESLGDISVKTYHRQLQYNPYRRIRTSIIATIRNRGVLHVSSARIDSIIQHNTNHFVSTYINYLSGTPYDYCDLAVVGSDQVWRASYADPSKYMFDDLKDDNVKRISYAASFGADDLNEFSADQIALTKLLAKKFSGVSVREDSGVSIVRKYWGINALHHVDPTLLLSAKEYSRLIDAEETALLDGSLFVYVLDRSLSNNIIIKRIEDLSGLKQFELMPKSYKSLLHFLGSKELYVMPKVEQWLRSFRDAEFIVTDSFHGTVFSIIFNKPFIAIGNSARGLARFTSLLKVFGLERRLITDATEVNLELLNSKIDWDEVNTIKKYEQKRSFEYLKKYLA